MENRKHLKNDKRVRSEGGIMLQAFRVLSAEEQRIAFAVLEGMRLQQTLDAQRKADHYANYQKLKNELQDEARDRAEKEAANA